jgi:hypothetical protein
MKKKVIIFICDVVVGLPVILVAVPMIIGFEDGYRHYMNLYDYVEQAEVLLESAYYYGIRLWATVALACSIYILLVVLVNRLLKYNSVKYSIKCFIIAIGCIVILLPLDLTVGSRIHLYKFFVVLNPLLSMGSLMFCSIYGYADNRKLGGITNGGVSL